MDNTSLFESSTTIPDVPRQYTRTMQIIALAIGTPIIVVSLIGNMFTIIAVIKTKSLRTSPNIFIISLSISDMLFASIIIPNAITVYWKNRWTMGPAYCRLFPMFLTFFFGGTLVSLGGIAISRFLKILYPSIFQKVFNRKRNAVALVTALWLCPPILMLPAATGLWGEIGYEPKTFSCTIRNDDSGYSTFLLSVAFFIPVLVISYCYLRILHKLYSNHKKVATMRQNGLPQGNVPSREQKQHREDYQFTKMMVLIFVIFVVAYAPNLLNNLRDPLIEDMNRRSFCVMFTWFSCCLNPIVYVVLNKQFRKAFITICMCRKCGHSADQEA